jgi:hypothetical protein
VRAALTYTTEEVGHDNFQTAEYEKIRNLLKEIYITENSQSFGKKF